MGSHDRRTQPAGHSHRISNQSSPLKSCFHLCGAAGTDLAVDLQSVQQRKLLKSRDEAGNPVSEDDISPVNSPKAKSISKKDALTKPLAPISTTRSTQRFNGMEGISLSKAGTWLDSRSFREACEAAGASPRTVVRPGKTTSRRRGELSDGERFILKRCKDVLIRKFGTLQNAFKKLDCNQSNGLAMIEFVASTRGLFKRAEAQILYRLLDNTSDGLVTLDELHSALEDA